MEQKNVVIIGGGVGGLAAAILLGRAGHRVTVIERDELPALPDVESAFEADRRGAPQAHQTHGFLARVVVELRRNLPDVLERLLAAGCTTMPGNAIGDPQPGDEDLSVLIVRRTTFDWVLRQAAVEEPGVELRGGVGVEGLVAETGAGGVPIVTGVLLEDGSSLPADVVVAATGRRGPVDVWMDRIGVDLREKVVQSGLMYLSRWYRLADEIDLTTLDAKLGGDLGFVKYLAVPGDGHTLSVTLAVRTDDREVRVALSDPDRFERACELLPGPDQFFGKLEMEPIGGVRPMGGLLNRARRFLDDDGRPTVLGFHAIGDSHTTTNPLYGRGCSMALIGAVALADAMHDHPADPSARAVAFEEAANRELRPWYQVSVQMDRMGADPTNAAAALGGGDGGQAGKGLTAVFAAAQTDPIIGRGIARFMNLLATPADLMADAALLERIGEVMADPDAIPVPPREGPKRSDLLAALSGIGAADDTATHQEELVP